MNFELRIFQDMESLGREAARIFIKESARAIEERGRFLTALNGGSTPERFFRLLGEEFREEIAWDEVHIFWGDERCVPPEEAGSNYRQAREAFLDRVPIPDSNVHRVRGELEPAEAARDYALTLSRFAATPLDFPRFDLVYLGMGEDGHTASLFPGSPVDITEPVLPVTAQYQDRPANRVTLTPLVINQARTVVFMATGEKKAGVLAEVLSGRYNPDQFPAQRIEPKDGRLIWLVDEEAAGRLPRELTRRFCEG